MLQLWHKAYKTYRNRITRTYIYILAAVYNPRSSNLVFSQRIDIRRAINERVPSSNDASIDKVIKNKVS